MPYKDPLTPEQKLLRNKRARRYLISPKGRAFSRNNKPQKRANARKLLTGFTHEVFEARLASQNYKCGICRASLDTATRVPGAPLAPCADHSHATKQCRGILCRKCNMLLGMANDDRQILERAIEYLDLWDIM